MSDLVIESSITGDHLDPEMIHNKPLLLNSFSFRPLRGMPIFRLLNLAVPKGAVYGLCGEHAERLPGIFLGSDPGETSGTVLIDGLPLSACSKAARARLMTLGHPTADAIPVKSAPLVLLLGTRVSLEAVQVYQALGRTVVLCANQPGDAFCLAHRVIVLKDGYISEAGSYERLASCQGLFNKYRRPSTKNVVDLKQKQPIYQQKGQLEAAF